MHAEILAVGNEVIMGHTVNTNASYIARKLQTVGIMPKYHTVVPDEQEVIEEALKQALNRCQVVIVTGGLGPTNDDLTKETVCNYLKLPLSMNEEILQNIKSYFEKTNRVMSENNKKQAMFPEKAFILPNSYGTAPGCILEVDKKYVVLLPGPPKELNPMFNQYVLPYFEKQQTVIYETCDVQLYGIGESLAAEKLQDILGEFSDRSVATYVGNGIVIVRITTWAQSSIDAKKKLEMVQKQIQGCLGTYIIGYNENTLEQTVYKMLKQYNYTVATAESCTGGLLAATLINCNGISSYFKEGMVTYSNEAKQKRLGVNKHTLEEHGAVSPNTAIEMAEGIKQVTGADIGIATTGIAGPGGGTKEKPVGLIYIGIAIKDQIYVYQLLLNGDRNTNRIKTVQQALLHLYKLLQ